MSASSWLKLAQPCGEGVPGRAVLGLGENVVLPAGGLGECATQGLPLPLPVSPAGGGVVVCGESGQEQLSAVRAEEPVGEKVRDGFENEVLAEVDRLRMASQGLLAASVVRLGPAGVVGARRSPVAEHLVEHPLGDEGFVARLWGPDPQGGVVAGTVLGTGRPAVEHLVAGVLRVVQDVVDRRPAPCPAGALRSPGRGGGG